MKRSSIVRVFFVALAGVFASCASPQEQQDQKPKEEKAAVDFGALSVSPNSGHASDQVFSVRLQRTAGSAVPTLVGLLINTGPSGGGGCYVFNVPETPRMLLVNDNGSGSREVAASQSLSNEQCELVADQPASSVSADAVVATFHVRFKPAFSGKKILFAMVQDGTGLGTGLRQVGDFTID